MKRLVIIVFLIGLILVFLYRKEIGHTWQGEAAKTRIENFQSNLFQSGDIIFQTSMSRQSRAIQVATKSKYSHMGMIYEEDGQYFVFEATQEVKLTKLEDWIKRGE